MWLLAMAIAVTLVSSGCKEVALLTQVKTHAMEALVL